MRINADTAALAAHGLNLPGALQQGAVYAVKGVLQGWRHAFGVATKAQIGTVGGMLARRVQDGCGWSPLSPGHT